MIAQFTNDEAVIANHGTSAGLYKSWETRREHSELAGPKSGEFETKEDAQHHADVLKSHGEKGRFKVSERRGRFILEPVGHGISGVAHFKEHERYIHSAQSAVDQHMSGKSKKPYEDAFAIAHAQLTTSGYNSELASKLAHAAVRGMGIDKH